ncbi:hypothetical protein [Streptomyces sp. NPDC003090]|uniref:hypothetical protein n=1 Tax=Streptomyces sp. NPDC003090 TaxID=3154274 RepID=UPI0038250946
MPLTNRAERRRERLRVHAGLLWDGTGSAPRDDVDVLVEGSRITAVEAHRARRPGHRTVDASRATSCPACSTATPIPTARSTGPGTP